MEGRGIVITHPFTVNKGFVQAHDNLSSEDIRQYLLYWDKIDLPQNNIIGIGEDTVEISYLKQLGILEESMIDFSGGEVNFESTLLTMQSLVLKERNKKDPGKWSLAQHGNFLNLAKNESSDVQTIEVELYNMIPVPKPQVSLDDILEFKEKRKPELLNFRNAMDDIYLEVSKSKDIPRSKLRVVSRLEQSLEEINIVFNENWSSKLLSTLKVELNLPNIVTNSVVGAALGTTFGASPEVAAAIGAVTAAMKFELKATKTVDGIPEQLKDFAYLHRITTEL